MLDYLMDFHAVCAISLFSMQNLVFLLVEKKMWGNQRKFSYQREKSFFEICFQFQRLDIVPSHCSLALGLPLQTKNSAFFKFQIFHV